MSEDGGPAGESTPGEDDSPTDERSGRPCPRCGAALYRRHCKYVCPNHGVVMDCADTFWN